MILTDRIRTMPPQGALEEVHNHYKTDQGEPESFGIITQYWVVSETHLFVVMIDGQIDGLRVFKLNGHLPKPTWCLSVDSQTKFTDDPLGDPTGECLRTSLARGRERRA